MVQWWLTGMPTYCYDGESPALTHGAHNMHLPVCMWAVKCILCFICIQRKEASFCHLLRQLGEQLGCRQPLSTPLLRLPVRTGRRKIQPAENNNSFHFSVQIKCFPLFHSLLLSAYCSWELDICTNIHISSDSGANIAPGEKYIHTLAHWQSPFKANLLLQFTFIINSSTAAVFASLMNTVINSFKPLCLNQL